VLLDSAAPATEKNSRWLWFNEQEYLTAEQVWLTDDFHAAPSSQAIKMGSNNDKKKKDPKGRTPQDSTRSSSRARASVQDSTGRQRLTVRRRRVLPAGARRRQWISLRVYTKSPKLRSHSHSHGEGAAAEVRFGPRVQ